MAFLGEVDTTVNSMAASSGLLYLASDEPGTNTGLWALGEGSGASQHLYNKPCASIMSSGGMIDFIVQGDGLGYFAPGDTQLKYYRTSAAVGAMAGDGSGFVYAGGPSGSTGLRSLRISDGHDVLLVPDVDPRTFHSVALGGPYAYWAHYEGGQDVIYRVQR